MGQVDKHIFVNWQADKGRESGMNHENTTSDRQESRLTDRLAYRQRDRYVDRQTYLNKAGKTDRQNGQKVRPRRIQKDRWQTDRP